MPERINNSEEALYLGEEIRRRIERVKEKDSTSISFDILLDELRIAKDSINSDEFKRKDESVKKFLASEWVKSINRAFALKRLNISFKPFDSIKIMEEYIFSEYGVGKVKGNSYVVRRAKDSLYEIGMYRFDILGFIHELGHIVKNRGMELNVLNWCNSDQTEDELNLNVFARSFWMPKKDFEETVIENSRNGECNVNAVAKHYAIDYIPALMRGTELYFWK